MTVKSLNPNAIASATSVTFRQKAQATGAFARDERILAIGNPQDGKSIVGNVIKQFANADDVGIVYGFGSPLHRMAMKLFPTDNNGSKVETYFIPIDNPTANSTRHTIEVSVIGTVPNKNFNCYLRFKELPFEAPADAVGKIATSYQMNPAKAPRRIDLNIFNKIKIPFTILKNNTSNEILNSLKSSIEEYTNAPFIGEFVTIEEVTTFRLVAKWYGETSKFSVDFVDENNNIITVDDYGVAFTTEVITEGIGTADLAETLNQITEELNITRIISQFNDIGSLDKLKNKCLSFRDGLICQWILSYTGKEYPENQLIPKTADIQQLIDFGNSRRDDTVNVIIAGSYHDDNGNADLRPLSYTERDLLLKAGISNLEPKITGGYRIGDLTTLYHPQGQQNPLFRYDRDITLIGNIGYDLKTVFDNSDEWKSIIIVSDTLTTDNDSARSIKDIKATLDTRLRLYGKNAWIADVDTAIENSNVQIDSMNPNRFNINPSFELSGVGRIFDIVNFVGFYFGNGN
jgi:hypothetical protein